MLDFHFESTNATRRRALVTIAILVVLFLIPHPALASKLRIGVTLHPYHAWVSNIVDGRAEIVPLIGADEDPHGYQIKAEDIAKIAELDVLILNGLGHDEFASAMLEASGNRNIVLIKPAEGVPLLQSKDPQTGELRVNSHSFIAITAATQQISTLASELGRIDPNNAKAYQYAARQYRRRLRQMLKTAREKLSQYQLDGLRIATVHDGYGYLFQDLGLTISAVIQPRHGLKPSPKQLSDTVRQLKQSSVDLLFTEADYGQRFAEVVVEETGAKTATLSHLSSGPYRGDSFEQAMARNLESIVGAIAATAPAKAAPK